MAINLDLDQAKKILSKAWESRNSAEADDCEISEAILEVISATDVTFKYILVTGVLASCTDNKTHPRSLQAGSRLQGAYDARSLCHGVVVPFEKQIGDLWGLSNEPFLNKPARHPEHSKDNPLRNRKLAEVLHHALDKVQSFNEKSKLNTLRFILKISSNNLNNRPQLTFQAKTNQAIAEKFMSAALRESVEGCSLVALMGNFFKEFTRPDFEVKVHPTTNSDTFSQTAGDIEVFLEKRIVAAVECKERPLTKEDVAHGIHKALQQMVPEYWFVTSAGIVESDRSFINDLVEKDGTRLDIHIFEFKDLLSSFTALLNPSRRAHLGENIVNLLSNDMKRSQFASKIANLWNTHSA